MTTIKDLRVIEINDYNGEIVIKKAVDIRLVQANICWNMYFDLKETDPTIKGIVFLIELTTVKDITIIR